MPFFKSTILKVMPHGIMPFGAVPNSVLPLGGNSMGSDVFGIMIFNNRYMLIAENIHYAKEATPSMSVSNGTERKQQR